MITTETPYKLAEIVRDTWPQLYILENPRYNKNNTNKKNDWKFGTRRECND